MPPRLLRAMAVAGLLVAVGACSDSGSDTVAPGTTTTPTSAASSTTTGATTDTTAASATTTDANATTTTGIVLPGEVVVRGTVSSVFLSARVLAFDPPVKGYSRVALTTETEYRKADGSPAMLVDLTEGSIIEATGTPGSGSPEALIARLVVIVG